MAVSCIVLAGGSSTRLGEPKQLLELRGRPVLQHVVDGAARSGIDDIVVVLGHAAAQIADVIELPEGARIVVNSRYAAGQSTSLKAGLAALDPAAEAAVVVLGDQPTVPARAYEVVVAAWVETGAEVVRARYDGEPGHPVLLARSSWPAFEALDGDTGARALIDRGGVRVHDVNLRGPAPVDIDTREDYEALLRAGPSS